MKKLHDDLDLIVESGFPVIEFCGEFYWVDDSVPYDLELGPEEEIEISIVPAIRRNIRQVDCEELPHMEIHDDNSVFDMGKIVDKENGYLPDSNKTVLKKILNLDIVNSVVGKFIVFDNDNNCYYCIKNGCSGCPVVNQCKVEVEIT